jgi:hypothetical protein
MRRVGVGEGNVSAAFTAFNQQKREQLLKEIEEEDKIQDEIDRKRREKEEQEFQKEEERLKRRKKLLAMGMSEEELESLGLGLIYVDDDPSVCTQIYNLWMSSMIRKLIIKGWKMLPCNQIPIEPIIPDDDRFIKGGATRKRCTHVCLLYQDDKCCWCSDSRNVLTDKKERRKIKQLKMDQERMSIEKEMKITKKNDKPRKTKNSKSWLKSNKKKKKMSIEEEKQEEQRLRLLKIPSIKFVQINTTKSRYVFEETSNHSVVVVVAAAADDDDDDDDDDGRVYLGYKEGRQIVDTYTRDQFYCHVCRSLGQDGRNIKKLVEEKEALDEEIAEEQRKEEEEQIKIDEDNKMEKAMELVRIAEQEAAQRKVEALQSGGGDNGANGEEKEEAVPEVNGDHHHHHQQQQQQQNIVKVDLADAANTRVHVSAENV